MNENFVADHFAEKYKQDKKRANETNQQYRNRIAEYLRDEKNLILSGQSVLDNKFFGSGYKNSHLDPITDEDDPWWSHKMKQAGIDPDEN